MSKTLQERFNERYTPEPLSGCWLWTGAVDTCGYGLLYDPEAGRTNRAHRIAWAIRRGAIPDGMHVLHKCDVRGCVNPDHLFLGAQAANMADMVSKGRQARGSLNGTAKLTEVQVLEIRNLYGKGVWTQGDLASMFGIVQKQVSYIVNRRTWKHV